MKSNIIKSTILAGIITCGLSSFAQTPGSSPGSPSAPGSQNVNPTQTIPGGNGYQPTITNTTQPYGGYSGSSGPSGSGYQLNGVSGASGSSSSPGMGGSSTPVSTPSSPAGSSTPNGVGSVPYNATPGAPAGPK